MTREEELLRIAGTHLGKKGGEGYSSVYDPSLLVKIPRSINRSLYSIDDEAPGFVGCDVWNCYEVSALTRKGLPVAAVAKISIPASSRYHVESKSLKLYLNSLNMERLGSNREECLAALEKTIESDLCAAIECPSVEVSVFTEDSMPMASNELDRNYPDILSLIPAETLDALEFKDYKSDPGLLVVEKRGGELRVKSDLLRSNCRVTHQPDWGTVFIYMKGEAIPSLESLLLYIVSHRTVFHFHEEICEMIFKHLSDLCSPEELMVACNYTRRGGIDINPVRASSVELIPAEYLDINLRMEKTLRQ